MAKIKYRYNPETLSYDIVTSTFKEKFIRFIVLIAVGTVISVSYFAVYSLFFDTPKERVLNNRMASLKFDYQVLMRDLAYTENVLSDIQKRDDNIYRIVLESSPIPASIRQSGFGGVNRYKSLEGYENSELVIAAFNYADIITKQLYIQSISFDELIDKTFHKEQMDASRPAIMPIAKKDMRNHLVANYGWRLHPVYKVWMIHTGLDFGAKAGTPIYATGDGTVMESEFRGGYGWTVVIDHGLVGYHTLYAHLMKQGAEVGTKVKRGQVIGYVGRTGTATSTHVHYEVHKNGYRNRVNPIHYFYYDMTEEEYFSLVEAAQNSEEIFDEWPVFDDFDDENEDVEVDNNMIEGDDEELSN